MAAAGWTKNQWSRFLDRRTQLWGDAHPGAALVHIGNGRVSDTCGALAADVAFAKDSLADEQARRGVGFRAFETLHDVIPELEGLWTA